MPDNQRSKPKDLVRNLFLKTGLYKPTVAAYNSTAHWYRKRVAHGAFFSYRAAALGLPLRANERRLLALKNSHKGERCVIIGNGPSLNQCDLTWLGDEITFGVNAIYLNYEKMGYHPTYYVVEDRFVAADRAEEIKSYTGPRAKFFGNYLKEYLDDAENAIWLNVIPEYKEYPGWPRFSTNAARELWVGGTVTYISLQLAYFMGFSEVYMIGFDHNYVVPEEDMVNEYDIHSTRDDVNHFCPDYFGKGKRWHDPRVDRMERCYHRAKEIYEADGRKIYNATAGGKLEVFERADYAKIFQK